MTKGNNFTSQTGESYVTRYRLLPCSCLNFLSALQRKKNTASVFCSCLNFLSTSCEQGILLPSCLELLGSLLPARITTYLASSNHFNQCLPRFTHQHHQHYHLNTGYDQQPLATMDLPTKVLNKVFDLCLTGASLTEKLELRLVNRCFCKEVTSRVLAPFYAHIIVVGHDFSSFCRPRFIGKWTSPLLQHLEVRVKWVETQKEQEEQLGEYHRMVNGFMDSCENIRSMEIIFQEPHNLSSQDNYIDEDWDRRFEGEPNYPAMCNEFHDRILDMTVGFIDYYATCDDLDDRRFIQISFICCPALREECMMACAGRNHGIIVGQDRFDKNKMVLQSVHSPDGQPPEAGDRPGGLSLWVAKQACKAMDYILRKYLATLPPRFDPQPQRWQFLADQIDMQRHLLIGASTAVAPDHDLIVPISIRGPFDTAISELEDATGCFQAARRISEGHLYETDKSYEMEILEAEACITWARAALEPAREAEEALAAEEQRESSDGNDGNDEGSRRSSTDDGRDGSDNGGGDDSSDETEDDADIPYYVYRPYVAVD